MTPYRKLRLSKQLYRAYSEAENQVEAQKIKDCAYELGILLCDSWFETVDMNNLKLLA